MPYHDYKIESMGSATITPKGSFEAGSWQAFKLIYKVGKFGLDDWGGISIGLRPHFDGSKLQKTEPKKEGYITVETSNNDPIEFEIESRRLIRPRMKSIFIRCLRFLKENDEIIIRLGDKRFGSPGLRMQTFCEKIFDFKILVDPFATQDYIPLPKNKNPFISIVPTDGKNWKLVAPSLKRPNNSFRISIKCEDQWGNPSNKINSELFLFSNTKIVNLPKSVFLKTGKFSKVIDGLKIKEEGSFHVILKNKKGKVLAKSNQIVIENKKFEHFWSDMHGQSKETIGTNSAEDYFDFGRNKSFLDICGHQGNDFQITDKFWKDLNNLTKKLNETGRFLALPGYEWSGNTAVGGDHNVWYIKEGRPIYRSSRALIYDDTDIQNDAHTSKELIEKLKNENAMVVAHVGGRYADITYAYNAKLEPSVEIHSAWGTFEWMLEDAFRENYRVGVVAASDGHKGRPGASYPGDSLFGSYGGLTCHLLKKLDRKTLFKEFRSRHHYATTGARIYLNVDASFEKKAKLLKDHNDEVEHEKKDFLMGDAIKTNESFFNLNVDIKGTSPLENIKIFDGLKLIENINPFEISTKKRFRITCSGQYYRGRSRLVQWECETILTRGKILKIKDINFWNPKRKPKIINEKKIQWKTVTTGGFSACDIWLDEKALNGLLKIKTNFKNIEVKLKDIIEKEKTFQFGGMDIKLNIKCLPDKLNNSSYSIKKKMNLRKGNESRIYIKVTQEDGHQAWSSPLYIKRDK